jgi:hypothetical protein
MPEMRIHRDRCFIVILAAAAGVVGACADNQPAPAIGGAPAPPADIRLTPLIEIDGDFGRVGEVAVDSRERVFVADVMANHVRVFDSQGRALTIAGRKGDGPGEFRAVSGLALQADSLFVMDFDLQRVTVFAPVHGDTIRVARTISVLRQGVLARHSLLVASDGRIYLQYAGLTMDRDGNQVNEHLALAALNNVGAMAHDSLLKVRDKEWLISRSGSGHVVEPMPYGKATVVRLLQDTLLVTGWTADTALSIHDHRGAFVGSIPIPVNAIPVTQVVVDAYIASVAATRGPLVRYEVERLKRAWSDGRLPETFPVFHDFIIDDTGRIWLSMLSPDVSLVRTSWGSEYSPGDSVEIVVLSPTGQLQGRSTLSYGQRLAHVRGSRAYAISRNELGVETITVLRLDNAVPPALAN